jgi:signal transduction histidine kinase/ActR/RegA family two-component response regulator
LSRFAWRAASVIAAALALVGLFSQTTLYPRIAWWADDAAQRVLGTPLAMDHVLVVDVDEESMRRLAPSLGAWPFARDAYARAARYLAGQGARAVAFDILFAEPREGDAAFALALGPRDVLAAAALPYSLPRSTDYQQQLARAALPASGATAASWPAQSWPDLTLPLRQLTASSQAHVGVISLATDADGLVRRVPLLHGAYGKLLPNLTLAALLAADPAAAPELGAGQLRLGTRSWPLHADGSVSLHYPSNADALPVMPFHELLAAAEGRQGSAHVGEAVRDKIVFLGSSSAVLGDFALTPAGRLPGLHLNALFAEMLLEGRVYQPPRPWLDLALLVLALAVPMALVGRGAAARPGAFLAGAAAIVIVIGGAGLALLALNQNARWLFALLCGLAAHGFALVGWQFALYREKQRLFYEKLAAQEANRMKTEFLNHMTHELRTPITAIMGFNKVNQFTDNIGREQRVHNSAIVARNCEHLLALVNNNLDLARIEAGQLAIERKPEDVAALLDDLVSTMRILAAEKHLALHLDKDVSLPPLLSLDAFRLQQVLLNLLGNAIKFTERGEVRLSAQWDAGELRLRVRDTGVGIPPEGLARVFEPFERGAARTVTGTGLGLTITRKLVELMGGSVTVSSAPQAGTTFEARIPAALAAETAPPDVPGTTAQAVTTRKMPPLAGRVLLAEDNENLRDLAELYLGELGLACSLVGNGLDAVETALAGTFDLLLMDLEMPVMDGFEAIRVLRERGYRGPIIALTAHRDSQSAERAMREGCNGVLRKPITVDNLRDAMAPLLAGGAAARPTGAAR